MGAYLDAKGKLRWIDVWMAEVREPCTHMAAGTFPPDSSIALSTYRLVAAPTDAIIEGVGCVAVRVRSDCPSPNRFAKTDRLYFTVVLKPLDATSARAYADDFERLVATMSGDDDAPCVHMFWTPQRRTPDRSTLEALLKRFRSLRGGKAAGFCRDLVVCVSVDDYFTPSLAWTLACAEFATPRDVEKSKR
jgi:hypothetical protein